MDPFDCDDYWILNNVYILNTYFHVIVKNAILVFVYLYMPFSCTTRI